MGLQGLRNERPVECMGNKWCGKIPNFLLTIILNAKGINCFNKERPWLSIGTFSFFMGRPAPQLPSIHTNLGPGIKKSSNNTGLGVRSWIYKIWQQMIGVRFLCKLQIMVKYCYGTQPSLLAIPIFPSPLKTFLSSSVSEQKKKKILSHRLERNPI